ncbi:hypothetical protein F4779DRAFT_27319, partial [Xylariaceae sp. FL0662B]
IPKPNDWGQHIDVAGFYFLNLASSYTPDPELAAFLEAGPPPIYIGFGSIVVDDPDGLTRSIFDAVAETGVRALVSKGWGGIGADSLGIPDGVFMLGNVPHDWLFKHVFAVCHHGGAGTTAAGINAGKPTIVVPFFGDQPFWGAMVARAGAGPDPIPYKELTAAALAEAIRTVSKPETQERARELGEKIREEKGADVGAQSFHKHLDVDKLRCSMAPSRVAVWRVRRTEVHLSALAATTLVNNGYLQYSDLKLFRAKEYSTEDHPTDPISATISMLLGSAGSIMMSVADFPRDVFKAVRKPKPKSTEGDSEESAVMASHGANSSATSLTSPSGSSTALPSTDAIIMPANPLSMRSGNSSAPNLASSVPASSGHSRSPSEPPPIPRRRSSPPSAETTSAVNINESLERALSAGKSINNVVATGVKSPMHFCLGLARGFRNAPRLYNDDTIRPTEKVTGFGSGLKVASKEFGFGMYDGITGLVTQPLRGAEKEGGIGLLKGFSKGIGGLVLKPAAGFWSIPAYTMAGVHAEIRSLFAQSAERYIIASRIYQGNDDLINSSTGEREDIEARWLAQKDNLKGFYSQKQKAKGKSREVSPSAPEHASVSREPIVGDEPPRTGWRHTKNLTYDERKRQQDQKKEWKKKRAEAAARGGTYIEEEVGSVSGIDSTRDQDDEYEHAIQAAVQETSRGNAVEDARIEQAVRSGVRILRTRSMTMNSLGSTSSKFSSGQDSGYMSDTKRPPSDSDSQAQAVPPHNIEDITDEEYQALIEQAVRLSIAEDQRRGIRMHDLEEESEEDEDLKKALERSQTDRSTGNPVDDEEYRKAIEASQAELAAHPHGNGKADDDEELRKAIEASQAEQSRPTDDDAELRRAIEESERAHKEELKRASTLRSEEDIVLEYVKKQSMAEEEYRRSKAGQIDPVVKDDGMDDDLRRALYESMQVGSASQRGGGGGPSRFP